VLYSYDAETGSLVPCAPSAFSAHGLLERFDMEKWVEADPTILGEDLMVITTEYSGFDKTSERLDVLAVDTEGRLVVVELKRDDSGKNVDLQALKYAAYCAPMTIDDVAQIHAEYLVRCGTDVTTDGAGQRILEFIAKEDFADFDDKPRIILVSKEFRPEVTSSVQWLRGFGLDITCIKWDVWELPDHKVVVDTSVLIPQPEIKDYQMRVERKEMAVRRPSRTIEATNAFFAQCGSMLEERTGIKAPTPRSQSYYQIPTAIGAVHFEFGFHGRPRSSLGVELHFEKSKYDQNRQIIETCEARLPQLQEVLGVPVTVEKPWGTRWARIYIESDHAEMNDELAEWAVGKMQDMIAVMRPVLEEQIQQ
jgi:hypothetical protein